MMEHPYYFTWCRQSDALTFEIDHFDRNTIALKDGREIYDLSSLSLQASFGLRNQNIINKIKKELDLIPISLPRSVFPLKDSVSERLLKYIGREGKLFYTTSGAESVENAAKIVRHLTKKKIIMARQRSYHGSTLGALSLTGDWRNKEHLTYDDWTLRIPEPDEDPNFEKARELIVKTGPEKIAAIILETITGANGVVIPQQSWYKGVQKACDDFGLFLILDEVVCGFGRTGTNFGFDHYPFLRPDFITMAKAITGGHIPFGALWTSPKIAEAYKYQVFSFGLTNYAHPLGLAALDAVLDIVTSSKFIKHRDLLINNLQKKLREVKKLPNVTAIRQIGMMAAIDITEPISWKHFIKHGVFLIANGTTLVIAPHLTEGTKIFNKAMDHFIEALKTPPEKV